MDFISKVAAGDWGHKIQQVSLDETAVRNLKLRTYRYWDNCI